MAPDVLRWNDVDITLMTILVAKRASITLKILIVKALQEGGRYVEALCANV